MLNIPSKFKSSQSSNIGFAYPLVIIKSGDSESDWIYLAQSKGLFDGNIYEDLDLKVGSINESVDISKRKFKINNVKISLSNYPSKPDRFSDKFSGIEFSGLEVSIYYATKNCKSLSDCAEVFKGYIRDYSSDNKKVSFDVEDYAQYIFTDRTFPKRQRTNSNQEAIESSKNKYYPVVYGINPRSKLLFTRESRISLESIIYADATYDPDIEIYGFRDIDSSTGKPLKIFQDDIYMDIYQTFQDLPSDPASGGFLINGIDYSKYNGLEQYGFAENLNEIKVARKLSDAGFTNTLPETLVSRDQFQISVSRKASGIRVPEEGIEADVFNYGSAEDNVGITFQGNQNGYYLNEISDTAWEFPQPGVDEVVFAGYYRNITFKNFSVFAAHKDIISQWDAFDFSFAGGHMFWLNEALMEAQAASESPSFAGACEMVFLPGTSENYNLIRYALNLNGDGSSSSDWTVSETTENVIQGQWHDTGAGMENTYSEEAGEVFQYSEIGNQHPALAPYAEGSTYGTASFHDGFVNTDNYLPFQAGFNKLTGLRFSKAGETDIIYGIDDDISDIVKSPYMDWLEDGETPTLRKLMWGRRIKEEPEEQTGIAKGSWVYGLFPVIGSVQPKSSYQDTYGTAMQGDDWLASLWSVVMDGMYAYQNPAFAGFKDVDILPYDEVEEVTEMYWLWLDNYDTTGDPYWLQMSNEALEALEQREEALANYYSSPDLKKLKRHRIEDLVHPDLTLGTGMNVWTPGWNWTVGKYSEEYGSSDFGNILNIERIQLNWTAYDMSQKPMLYSMGSHAVVGGDSVPISYSSDSLKVAKLDIGFDSISGDDIVIGSNYSRFKAKVEADVMFSSVQTAGTYPLRFLVEADCFKKDLGRDNLIRFDIDSNTSVADINDDGSIGANYYTLTSGNPDEQPTNEAGDSIGYTHSSFGEDNMIELDFDLDNKTVFSECDATSSSFDEIRLSINNNEGIPVDEWRENINNVNSISIYAKIDRDIPDAEVDDNGNFIGSKSGGSAQAFVRLRVFNPELHQSFVSGNMTQLDYYGDVWGRVDEWVYDPDAEQEVSSEDGTIITDNGIGKYTGNVIDNDSIDIEGNSVIRRPGDILMHILDKEFNYGSSNLGYDEDAFVMAREEYNDWYFDFTIFDKIDFREFVEDFSKSTMFLPKFKYDGTFTVETIKPTYTESDITIQSRDVLKFNYKKTDRKDMYLKVRVSYDWDDGFQDYKTSTYTSGNGLAANKYQDIMDNFKINSIDDVYLEFESKYIKDIATAKKLEKYLLGWHMNVHNIINCKLPHKYIGIECGDIVDFDSLIQDTKMFGEDYTQSFSKYGQTILPFFIVESVKKSVTGVDVKLIQLHDLSSFTSSPYDPVAAFYGEEENQNLLFGDANLDGFVDVLDVVTLISAIVNVNVNDLPATADMNQDGSVNVLDVVMMVQLIVG